MTPFLAAVLSVSALTVAQPPVIPAATAPESGKVVLECVVASAGSLTDCLVVEETPPGHGLGQRALDESAKLKMDVPTVNGVAVTGARVRIPFTFQL